MTQIEYDSTILNGRHYRTGEKLSLRIINGHIAEISKLSAHPTDVQLPWIAPGLVDLQINGYKGLDFNTTPIADGLVQRVTRELYQQAVTTYYPTVITNSDAAIELSSKAIAKACDEDKESRQAIAGIHLEGPFLSPEDGARGAHDKRYVKAPDWELFQRWQEAAGGRIRIVTISPEWPNSSAFIQACVKQGITVSIGHTSASPEQIRNAVFAGAKMSTHLGNGSHILLPRHSNYLWEQLAQEELWACMIADGFHLPESVLKVFFKTKGKRAMLVSDAVYLSGLEPGTYETHIGGKVVLTAEGRLHTAENPKILAGSAQMLKWGIEHVVRHHLATLADAWEMASIRPMEAMYGSQVVGIKAGAPADLVLFHWDGHTIGIHQTYKQGNLVFQQG